MSGDGYLIVGCCLFFGVMGDGVVEWVFGVVVE